jgi:ferredoxin
VPAIHFRTSGRTVEFDAGDDVNMLRAALRHEAGVPFKCASGNCGTDRVLVESGAEHLSPPRKREREMLGPELLAAGYRLACQTYVEGDCTVSWDPDQKPLISDRAAEALTKKWLSGEAPALKDGDA